MLISNLFIFLFNIFCKNFQILCKDCVKTNDKEGCRNKVFSLLQVENIEDKIEHLNKRFDDFLGKYSF